MLSRPVLFPGYDAPHHLQALVREKLEWPRECKPKRWNRGSHEILMDLEKLEGPRECKILRYWDTDGPQQCTILTWNPCCRPPLVLSDDLSPPGLGIAGHTLPSLTWMGHSFDPIISFYDYQKGLFYLGALMARWRAGSNLGSSGWLDVMEKSTNLWYRFFAS